MVALGSSRTLLNVARTSLVKSYSAITDTKPETYLKFLKLLEGKDHRVHNLAVRDLEQKSLGAETRAAVLNVGDIKNRMYKRVLQEILEKCMFLYVNQKHHSVATSTTWDDLMQRAVA